MSTKLTQLLGKIEIPNIKTQSPDYKDVEVHINSFWGGEKRGKSLQLGFHNADGEYQHIQLDNENVRKLCIELQEHFI